MTVQGVSFSHVSLLCHQVLVKNSQYLLNCKMFGLYSDNKQLTSVERTLVIGIEFIMYPGLQLIMKRTLVIGIRILTKKRLINVVNLFLIYNIYRKNIDM